MNHLNSDGYSPEKLGKFNLVKSVFIHNMQKSFQVKMHGKQLENEAKRCMTEADKHRKRAQDALKKGSRAAAQMYAQSAVRFEQQANQLLQQAATTIGYSIDMRAAETTTQMANTMSLATGSMAEAANKVNLDQVSANRTKMDGLKQKLEAAHHLLTVGEGDLEIQSGADDLLLALERENQEYEMAQICDIPQGIPEMGGIPFNQYGEMGK